MIVFSDYVKHFLAVMTFLLSLQLPFFYPGSQAVE